MQAEHTRPDPRTSSFFDPPRGKGAALAPVVALGNRAAIEAEIERLIAILDRYDPDPDLEPSLGWNEAGAMGEASPVSAREEDEDFELEGRANG